MARKRVDSVAARVEAIQAVQIVPPSNVPLTDADIPFFASIIAEFARAEWSAHQLELAAMLAQKMRLLRDELAKLEAEGFVITTVGGNLGQNPRLGAVRMLDTSILATRRNMQLHARAQSGEARDTSKRSAATKSNEALPDDGLLARPN